MKNKQLESDVKEIVGTPNVIVEKSTTTENAINVYVLEPSFKDIGTYPYYDRKVQFESDFESLTKQLAEKNAKGKN